jgi:hypothetical protein
MASPNTLKIRSWQIKRDEYLKGYYIHRHEKGKPGIPYRRK